MLALRPHVRTINHAGHDHVLKLRCRQLLERQPAALTSNPLPAQIPQQVDTYLDHPRPERARGVEPPHPQENPAPEFCHEIIELVFVGHPCGEVAPESRIEMAKQTPPLSLS